VGPGGVSVDAMAETKRDVPRHFDRVARGYDILSALNPGYSKHLRWSAQRLGVAPGKTEVNHVGPLPQYFGDQFGWPELVAEVAAIYHALPEDERAVACIFANNYGEAGAVNLFGPDHGLPPAISAHQTHYLWGPGDCTGEVVIVLQGDADGLAEVFGSVEEAGEHFHPWGMAEENRPIHLCRDLDVPLAELWPRLKIWN